MPGFNSRVLFLPLFLRMQVFRFFVLACFFLVSIVSIAYTQQYNYVQYTTKDGLAGSTVYDACQDQNGFIWFGTDNGVSRFDGKNFKNYTIEDGLPDNDVLVVKSDLKGRVWFGTFSREICYWYNGKIYNKYNDSMMAKFNFRQSIHHFVVMPDETIYITDLFKIYRISNKNEVLDLGSFFPHKKMNQEIATQGLYWFDNQLDIFFDDSLFFFDGIKLNFYKSEKINSTAKFVYGKLTTPGDTPVIKIPYDIIKTFGYLGTPYLLSSTNGAWEIDTIRNKIKEQFLAGRSISQTIIDKEGIYWFCTVGEGIFKLASKNSYTIPFPANDGFFKEVFSINKWQNKIYAGLGQSRLAVIQEGKLAQIRNFSSYLPNSLNNIITNRLTSINVQSQQNLYLGFDAFLVRYNEKQQIVKPVTAIKSIEISDSNQLLISSSDGVRLLDGLTLNLIHRIYTFRSTVSVFHKSFIYIGTLNGLYVIKPNGWTEFLGEKYPVLQRRITDITLFKDKVWVATNDMGIVLLEDGKPSLMVNEKIGLGSNNCKTIFTDSNFLWVGTNKGLNRISFENTRIKIQIFNDYDLLPSNIINAIYADSSEVWVGTPEGITYFKTDATNSLSACNLYVEKVNNKIPPAESGKIKTVLLSGSENRLEISFVGISMKAGGEILYHYTLEGLDKEWISTSNRMVKYASLPPGNYTMKLYAQNKFGLKSKIILIPVIVSPAFWQTKWFLVLSVVVVAGTFWFLFYIRKKNLEKLYERKNRVQQQMNALEQQALQSQMNPHFIFNCLNSIQQFVLTNEPDEANRFLTKFATLIRETLENSTSKYISLKKEIDYLERYLELECLRFGNTFTYNIDLHKNLDAGKIYLPVMLFQPFIENAIRHGIRNRPDTKGEVNIKFFREGDSLIGMISDNGIGRENARKMRSDIHIEYQSRGMELTKKRAAIFNLTKENKIEFVISDVNPENPEFPGTEIIIKINFLQNDKKDQYRTY